MENVVRELKTALVNENGYAVAHCITPVAPKDDPDRLYSFYRSTNDDDISSSLRYALVYNSDLGLSKAEVNAWIEVFVAYWKAIGELLYLEDAQRQSKAADAKWSKLYEAWKELVNQLIRGFTNNAFPAWTIPCLYVGGKYLRIFAIKTDEQARMTQGEVTLNEGFQDDIVGAQKKNETLEDAARQVNRIFGCCVNDRAPIEDSRKWGTYYTANLLFKIYFKLNSVSLSKNILRTLRSQEGDMPPFRAYPRSHQVTFNYYAGVIHFLDEDYQRAEEYLAEAWAYCHKASHKNRQLILTYLIPCHLLTANTLPSAALLSQYPHLERLFKPLATAIKRADLAAFDAALDAGEPEFVKRRIYLTLERGRDIVLRNLLRKVFIAGGYEPLKDGQTEADLVRRTRISVAEFTAAVRLSLGQRNGEVVEPDEVECMLANMIYKNLMKGYISRERSMVVLNKKGAFPGTGV